MSKTDFKMGGKPDGEPEMMAKHISPEQIATALVGKEVLVVCRSGETVSGRFVSFGPDHDEVTLDCEGTQRALRMVSLQFLDDEDAEALASAMGREGWEPTGADDFVLPYDTAPRGEA